MRKLWEVFIDWIVYPLALIVMLLWYASFAVFAIAVFLAFSKAFFLTIARPILGWLCTF